VVSARDLARFGLLLLNGGPGLHMDERIHDRLFSDGSQRALRLSLMGDDAASYGPVMLFLGSTKLLQATDRLVGLISDPGNYTSKGRRYGRFPEPPRGGVGNTYKKL
jgi:hypothetical protein